MSAEAPHPTLNAMLICDKAIREEGAGKISLIGIFAAIWVPKFPVVHGSLCIYVNLGDAQGSYVLKLQLMRADNMRGIGSTETTVSFADRMTPAELVFELHGLVFESPGRYEFVLTANEHLGGRKSFDVLQLERSAGDSRGPRSTSR